MPADGRLTGRITAAVAVTLLAGPVIAGIAGVLLPAFDHLPSLGHSGPTLEPWRRLLSTPGLADACLLSLTTGLISAAASLAIVICFLAGASGTATFTLATRLLSPTLAVPHAAAAFGLAFLIAPSGYIARLLSPWLTGWNEPPDLLIVNDKGGIAMVAGLIIKEVPFLLLMSLAALPALDPGRRVAVARSLGYGRVKAFVVTVAPALYRSIRLPVLAVAAYATSVVDVAMVLGPANPPPLSVAIVKWMADPDLQRRFMASAGAILQIIVTAAALGLWLIGERLAGLLLRRLGESGERRFPERAVSVVGVTAVLLSALAVIGGLLLLIVWSFAGLWRFPALAPSSLAPDLWLRLLPHLSPALSTTLALAATATLISLVVVVAALENEVRRQRPADAIARAILFLPLLVPPVGFLFGLTVVHAAIGLTPGWTTALVGHVVFVMPYVYLSLSGPYHGLDPRYARAAAALGATPLRQFLAIRLPLLMTPLLTAAAVGIAVSIGQYLPTQLLGAGRVTTITTEAVALASGGDRRVIGVTASLQALLPAIGFVAATLLPWLVWRHRRGMRSGR